jgi:hypothetical protein
MNGMDGMMGGHGFAMAPRNGTCRVSHSKFG